MMLRRHPRLRRSIDHFSFDELLRLSKCEFAGISGAKGREDLASLAKLTALRLLQLWNTKVSDVAPLAELTALQVLSLKGTRVSDLVPISNLTALQSLSLMGTDVTDLAPIGNLAALRSLSLIRIRVTDLTPIANLTALIDGAKHSPRFGGLSFSDCPLADPVLRGFEKLPNPERTIKTIGYLRTLHRLSPVSEASQVRPKTKTRTTTKKKILLRRQARARRNHNDAALDRAFDIIEKMIDHLPEPRFGQSNENANARKSVRLQKQ
jgi:hypothetical protein